MILELDCGNSFIKWRVLHADATHLVAEGVVDSDLALLDSLHGCVELDLKHCRLVSVRTNDETAALVTALADAFGVVALCAAPSKAMSGVENGYEDFQRLGLDRWLAMLGAYHLAAGACLVLDFGTALTADFIAADGKHLGDSFARVCPSCVINYAHIPGAFVMTILLPPGLWKVSLRVAIRLRR